MPPPPHPSSLLYIPYVFVWAQSFGDTTCVGPRMPLHTLIWVTPVPTSFLPHPPISLENTKLLISPVGAIIVRARELTYWFLTFFFLLSPHQDVWLWRQASTGSLIIQAGSLFFTPQLTAVTSLTTPYTQKYCLLEQGRHRHIYNDGPDTALNE